MLRYINDLPKHVIGIHATGKVTETDIENVLNPRIKELIDRQDEVNYLLLLETDIQNWSTEAWWENLKNSFRNFSRWNRIAVVSDQKNIEWFTSVLRFFIPGQSKGFEFSELQAAINWVAKQDQQIKCIHTMESTLEGFDRANGQGKNHDIKGNVENAGNDMVKKEDDSADNKDLAKEIPTVTPETESADGDESPVENNLPNDTPELENPTDQTSSNKGQGPAGEDL